MSKDIAFLIDIEVTESAESLVAEGALQVLETAAQATLIQQNVSQPVALTLLLTDDIQLQQFNRDYRGYDQPTDVLSFENGMEMPDIGLYLGDIAISVETAVRQAAVAGHTPLAELRLLTVHGVLHLLGHDHAQEEEKERMWAAQDEIIGSQEQG